MSNSIYPQLLTLHKLYFEFTSQTLTQSIAHTSIRLFSGRIPELEWAAEFEPSYARVIAFLVFCSSSNLFFAQFAF